MCINKNYEVFVSNSTSCFLTAYCSAMSPDPLSTQLWDSLAKSNAMQLFGKLKGGVWVKPDGKHLESSPSDPPCY